MPTRYLIRLALGSQWALSHGGWNHAVWSDLIALHGQKLARADDPYPVLCCDPCYSADGISCKNLTESAWQVLICHDQIHKPSNRMKQPLKRCFPTLKGQAENWTAIYWLCIHHSPEEAFWQRTLACCYVCQDDSDSAGNQVSSTGMAKRTEPSLLSSR